MPCRLIAELLGVHQSTISLATGRVAPLLEQHGITIAPATARISSLDDLRSHAAAAGITIPEPPQPHTPPDSTLQARDTPETHVITGRVLAYQSLRDHEISRGSAPPSTSRA